MCPWTFVYMFGVEVDPSEEYLSLSGVNGRKDFSVKGGETTNLSNRKTRVSSNRFWGRTSGLSDTQHTIVQRVSERGEDQSTQWVLSNESERHEGKEVHISTLFFILPRRKFKNNPNFLFVFFFTPIFTLGIVLSSLQLKT